MKYLGEIKQKTKLCQEYLEEFCAGLLNGNVLRAVENTIEDGRRAWYTSLRSKIDEKIRSLSK